MEKLAMASLPVLRGAAKKAFSDKKAKGLMGFLKGVKGKYYDKPFQDLPRSARHGLMRDLRKGGVDSLTGIVSDFVLPKKLSDRVKKVTTRYVGMPALKADIAAGKALEKVTPFKNMFKIKEKVPLGGKKYEEITRPSGIAPVTKTMGFVVPIAGGMAIEDKLQKMFGDEKDMKKEASETVILEKTAATKLASELIRLMGETQKLAQANTDHEKRCKAERLVYKQASLGIIELPRTYEELQEKVASLANQDLDIVEKALEFQIGDASIGQLHNSTASMPTTPEGQFAATLIDDDFFN